MRRSAQGGYPAVSEDGKDGGDAEQPKQAPAVPPLRMPLSERRKLFARPILDVKAVRVETTTQSGDILLIDGVANRNAVTPAASSFASQYELGTSLGSGTMAVVKTCKRRSDGAEFAVKCVAFEDEELIQITRDEFYLLREICMGHDAILKVYDLMELGCKMWIVMELCAEGSVQSYVERNGAFAEAAACQLFWQLLRGVNYLHGRRVVHRDLKPDNLLLHAGASSLRIADFNSAKRVGTGVGCSLMLTDRGTHLYSAPELRFGRLWNERIDVWTSGLCLFFMLRACIPFNAEVPSVAKQLLSGQLPAMSLGSVRGVVQNLVRQCLTVNMQDRPPAMELLHHPAFSIPEISTQLRRSFNSVYKGEPRALPQDPSKPSSRSDSKVMLKTQSGVTQATLNQWNEGVLPACGLIMVRVPRDSSRSMPNPSVEPVLSVRKPSWDLLPDTGTEEIQRSMSKRRTAGMYPKDSAEAMMILAKMKCERNLAAEEGVANDCSPSVESGASRETSKTAAKLSGPDGDLPEKYHSERSVDSGSNLVKKSSFTNMDELMQHVALLSCEDDEDEDEEGEEGILPLAEDGEILSGSPSPASSMGGASPGLSAARFWTMPSTAIQWNT